MRKGIFICHLALKAYCMKLVYMHMLCSSQISCMSTIFVFRATARTRTHTHIHIRVGYLSAPNDRSAVLDRTILLCSFHRNKSVAKNQTMFALLYPI